jgi:hypothetical protein
LGSDEPPNAESDGTMTDPTPEFSAESFNAIYRDAQG